MSTTIPYVLLDDPRYGEAVQVSPLITRVIAKNPSKFTYLGTGTYLVGVGAKAAQKEDNEQCQAGHDVLLDQG